MRVLRWDDGFTTRALRGYRQFMGLKIRMEDWDAAKLASPPIIEQVWQQHILDVNHYGRACGEGRRIHHNPDDGSWDESYTSRARATELALEGATEPVDAEIWTFAQPENCRDDDGEEEAQPSRKRRRRNDSSTTSSSTNVPRRTDAITFFVRWAQNNNHQRPNDLYFKIRPDTKMARVFERFNMHWATNEEGDEDFTFFFGGKMVRPHDTANTMGLVSDDMINATRCKAVLDTD